MSDTNVKTSKGQRRANCSERGAEAESPEAYRVGEDRPVILLSAEIHEATDSAVEVLANDADVYQRDGELVRVTRTAECEADALSLCGTPSIRKVALATLRERLTRAAQWQKYDARSKGYVNTTPNDAVVQAVAARGQFRGVRPIVGIAEAPMLRPDGTVLERPGYDAATGYVLIANDRFDVVPNQPTQDDARAALSQLTEVFADFPYRTEADRVVPIAAILTLLARPAICGSVPAVVFDANTRGSGKTLQTDVIAVIATGRTTAKMTYPPDDVELEKVLASYALRGSAIIGFDNVTGRFGGGPLDRVLTAGGSVELRVLGKSEIPTLPWRALVITTGNNVEVVGDTRRRVLLSRLESSLERPEDRDGFRHPKLLEWVYKQRSRLVVAALTVLRAWVVAGRPLGGCRTWGSFEAWSAIVPPALLYAGASDPMNCRMLDEAEDPERRALVAILDALPRLDQGEGLTAKAVIAALYPAGRETQAPDGFEDLRDAIEELVPTVAGRPPSPVKLGAQLRKFKRRVIAGKRLDMVPDRKGVGRWRVVSAVDAGFAGLVNSREKGNCQR